MVQISLVKLFYLVRYRLSRYLLICIVLASCSWLIYQYIALYNKANVNVMETTYPIEVVQDVRVDTLMQKKYAVKIVYINRVEQVYWLHTDKKYEIGDTIKTFL